jgi:hypothetical protein
MNMAILLIFAIIIIAVMAFRFLVPLIGRLLSVKLNFKVVSAYLCILILFSLIPLFLPRGNLLKTSPAQIISPSGFTYMNQMYRNIQNGDFSAPSDLELIYNHSYAANYHGFTLNDTNVGVYIGTKGIDAPDNDDGRIDAYYYSLPLKIANINLAAKDAPEISFDGRTLNMKSTNYIAEFYSFNESRLAWRTENSTQQILNQVTGVTFNALVILLPRGVTISGGNYSPLKDLSLSGG